MASSPWALAVLYPSPPSTSFHLPDQQGDEAHELTSSFPLTVLATGQ